MKLPSYKKYIQQFIQFHSLESAQSPNFRFYHKTVFNTWIRLKNQTELVIAEYLLAKETNDTEQIKKLNSSLNVELTEEEKTVLYPLELYMGAMKFEEVFPRLKAEEVVTHKHRRPVLAYQRLTERRRRKKFPDYIKHQTEIVLDDIEHKKKMEARLNKKQSEREERERRRVEREQEKIRQREQEKFERQQERIRIAEEKKQQKKIEHEKNKPDKIIVRDLKGNIVYKFKTSLECAEFFNVDNKSVYRWIKGIYKPKVPYTFSFNSFCEGSKIDSDELSS